LNTVEKWNNLLNFIVLIFFHISNSVLKKVNKHTPKYWYAGIFQYPKGLSLLESLYSGGVPTTAGEGKGTAMLSSNLEVTSVLKRSKHSSYIE